MNNSDRMKQAAAPSPVYGCADQCCAEEVSYPADMLFWWSGIGAR